MPSRFSKLTTIGVLVVAFAAASGTSMAGEEGGTGLVRVDQAFSLGIGRPLFSTHVGYFSSDFTGGDDRFYTFTPGMTLGLGAGFEGSASLAFEGLSTKLDGDPFDRRFDLRRRDLTTRMRWTAPLGTTRLRTGVQGMVGLPLGDKIRAGGTVDPDQPIDIGVMGMLSTNIGWFNFPLRFHANAGYWWSRDDGSFYNRSHPVALPISGTGVDGNDLALYGFAIETGLRRVSLFTELVTEQLVNARGAVHAKENLWQLTPGIRTKLTPTIELTAAVSFNLSRDDAATAFDPDEVYPDYELRATLTLGDILARERSEAKQMRPMVAFIDETPVPAAADVAPDAPAVEPAAPAKVVPVEPQADAAAPVRPSAVPAPQDGKSGDRLREIEERLEKLELLNRLESIESRIGRLEKPEVSSATAAPAAPALQATPAVPAVQATPVAPPAAVVVPAKAAGDSMTAADTATSNEDVAGEAERRARVARKAAQLKDSIVDTPPAKAAPGAAAAPAPTVPTKSAEPVAPAATTTVPPVPAPAVAPPAPAAADTGKTKPDDHSAATNIDEAERRVRRARRAAEIRADIGEVSSVAPPAGASNLELDMARRIDVLEAELAATQAGVSSLNAHSAEQRERERSLIEQISGLRQRLSDLAEMEAEAALGRQQDAVKAAEPAVPAVVAAAPTPADTLAAPKVAPRPFMLAAGEKMLLKGSSRDYENPAEDSPARAELDSLASGLIAHRDVILLLLVHGSGPDRDASLTHTDKLARQLCSFLVDAGVEAAQLQSLGMGLAEPLFPVESIEGATNARVEISRIR